jgi:ferric-dicitrate binding protein FerR (iron transport regulator)
LRARLLRLEEVVEDRDREHREAIERVEERVRQVDAVQTKRVDALRLDLEEERAGERLALSESLGLQKSYAGLFAFGVLLSTAGSLAS